jgi:hypothetical protein
MKVPAFEPVTVTTLAVSPSALHFRRLSLLLMLSEELNLSLDEVMDLGRRVGSWEVCEIHPDLTKQMV